MNLVLSCGKRVLFHDLSIHLTSVMSFQTHLFLALLGIQVRSFTEFRSKGRSILRQAAQPSRYSYEPSFGLDILGFGLAGWPSWQSSIFVAALAFVERLTCAKTRCYLQNLPKYVYDRKL